MGFCENRNCSLFKPVNTMVLTRLFLQSCPTPGTTLWEHGPLGFDESISGTELVDGVWFGGDGLLVKLKEDKNPETEETTGWESWGARHLSSVLLSFHFFFLCTLQSKHQGSIFVRIHAPWQVLAREAEFLKIKVPTKKV